MPGKVMRLRMLTSYLRMPSSVPTKLDHVRTTLILDQKCLQISPVMTPAHTLYADLAINATMRFSVRVTLLH